ncbi:hypothetical protein JAAARDRAFT_466379 [Jaapia argillacea MUCL 33604]|uniref:Uncharacterized protein n=1 Tax=Jaapia argillacea MUCL 33604 TaxID=933084 RepID=A0A067QJ22_9AGAM|nr:hypothetical protein JAAARDRAFT_466379 [Jaapia argillacea MUCL 33604]
MRDMMNDEIRCEGEGRKPYSLRGDRQCVAAQMWRMAGRDEGENDGWWLAMVHHYRFHYPRASVQWTWGLRDEDLCKEASRQKEKRSEGVSRRGYETDPSAQPNHRKIGERWVEHMSSGKIATTEDHAQVPYTPLITIVILTNRASLRKRVGKKTNREGRAR